MNLHYFHFTLHEWWSAEKKTPNTKREWESAMCTVAGRLLQAVTGYHNEPALLLGISSCLCFALDRLPGVNCSTSSATPEFSACDMLLEQVFDFMMSFNDCPHKIVQWYIMLAWWFYKKRESLLLLSYFRCRMENIRVSKAENIEVFHGEQSWSTEAFVHLPFVLRDIDGSCK